MQSAISHSAAVIPAYAGIQERTGCRIRSGNRPVRINVAMYDIRYFKLSSFSLVSKLPDE
jgi:hypothetical protein